MQYEISLPRKETWEVDPATQQRVLVFMPGASEEQLAALGLTLQSGLAGFIGFEAYDAPAAHELTISYTGEVVDDVEQRRDAEIDAVLNAWWAQVQEGQG